MERSCERAIELGLPAVAFTDHVEALTDTVAPCRASRPEMHVDGP